MTERLYYTDPYLTDFAAGVAVPFTTIAIDPLTGDQVTTSVVGSPLFDTAPAGHQWSAGLKGTYDAFGFGLTYP